MSLQDLVSVSISSSTVTPTRPGFGTPLLAAFHTLNTDRVRFYSSLAGAVGDGFAATGATAPAYKALSLVFSANPAPAKVAVGRRALPTTQVLQMVLSSASASDTYAYTLVGWDGVVNAVSMASTGVANTDVVTMKNLINTPTAVLSNAGGIACTSVKAPDSGISGTLVVTITLGGTVTTATASWKMGALSGSFTTAASNVLSGTGMTLDFGSGTAVLGDTLTFTVISNVGTVTDTLTPGTLVFTQDGSHGHLVDIQGWNPLGITTPILALTDASTDPGIATDLNAIKAAAPPGSFYGVALDSNSKAEVTAAAAWTESAGAFLMLFNNSDTVCITTATSDIFTAEKALSHARSGGLYAGQAVLSFSGLAWLAKCLPATPGSLTFMYKKLAGVLADGNLSETAQLNLAGKNANYYVTIAGVNVTIGGIDGAGEFLDIVWGTDALTAQIQIDIFAALAGSPKIPYSDLGVAVLVSIITADLNLFADNAHQFIDPKGPPTITVTAPPVASIAAATRATRVFPPIAFQAKLAGAIHSLSINGVLSA